MRKPDHIQLASGEAIPILYEDRSVMAIDKPPGWMLVPFSWQRTNRNLQAAITSSIAAGDFWARSRSLRYLRNVHRLDAETSGVLLLAKSPGVLEAFSDLFESRQMEKRYLAVAEGVPKQDGWAVRLKLAPDPKKIGKIVVSAKHGKEAETHFRAIETRQGRTLIEARPVTGRTHQIRVHLAQSGLPIQGDPLYGSGDAKKPVLALRAVSLAYMNPFERRRVVIEANYDRFLAQHGFAGAMIGREDAQEGRNDDKEH